MLEIKAPHDYKVKSRNIFPYIFLAGSIEMGEAEPWQERILDGLSDLHCVVLNPRRKDWDSSWKQTIDNKNFREQVEWELSAQRWSDLVVVYFASGTKSPITLLELGLNAHRKNTIVYCAEDFWRKGNVEVVCDQCELPLYTDEAEFIKAIRKWVENEFFHATPSLD